FIEASDCAAFVSAIVSGLPCAKPDSIVIPMARTRPANLTFMNLLLSESDILRDGRRAVCLQCIYVYIVDVKHGNARSSGKSTDFFIGVNTNFVDTGPQERDGTTRSTKGTRKSLFLCLLCFLWFRPLLPR